MGRAVGTSTRRSAVCSWITQRSRNSGRYFSTGSSKLSLPSSTSMATAVADIGLVIEAIQKKSLVSILRLLARSLCPIADRCRMRSFVATSMTAPEISPWSTKACIRSGMAANLSWARAGPSASNATAKLNGNREDRYEGMTDVSKNTASQRLNS